MKVELNKPNKIMLTPENGNDAFVLVELYRMLGNERTDINFHFLDAGIMVTITFPERREQDPKP